MGIPPSFEFQVSSMRIGNSPFMILKFVKGGSHGFIMARHPQNSSNNSFSKIWNMSWLLDAFPIASTSSNQGVNPTKSLNGGFGMDTCAR